MGWVKIYNENWKLIYAAGVRTLYIQPGEFILDGRGERFHPTGSVREENYIDEDCVYDPKNILKNREEEK